MTFKGIFQNKPYIGVYEATIDPFHLFIEKLSTYIMIETWNLEHKIPYLKKKKKKTNWKKEILQKNWKRAYSIGPSNT